jgi:hypothetical protein
MDEYLAQQSFDDLVGVTVTARFDPSLPGLTVSGSAVGDGRAASRAIRKRPTHRRFVWRGLIRGPYNIALEPSRQSFCAIMSPRRAAQREG